MVFQIVKRCSLRMNTKWQLVLLMIVTSTTIAAFPSRSRFSLRRSLHQQHQSRRYDQTTEDDGIVFGAADTEEASTRLVIEPFQLKLSKYSSTFTESELFDLRDIMEYIALRDIQNYTSSSTTPMGQLQLIKFGAAKQVLNTEYEVVLVKFDFGIAQYDSLPIPDAITINEWIGTAFTTKLLPNLKSMYPNSAFALLENISYALQYPQNPPLVDPTNSSIPNSNSTNNGTYVPDDGDDSGKNTTDDTASSSKSSSRSNIPLIAGVAVGAAACMMLVILALVAKQRRDTNKRGSVRELTHTTLDFDQQPSPSKKTKKQQQPRGGTNSAETSPSSSKGGSNSTSQKVDTADARSLADSESEWTVATEAGDTMALKNIVPTLNNGNNDSAGGEMATNWSSSKNDRQINLIMSESFERDRNVAITKDMLTGQWSGRVSNHRGGTAQHHQAQSESVLQPSHFSASQERRIRKAQRAAAAAAAASAGGGDTNNAAMPDRENSSVSSRGDESSVDDLLVFEQAHEDASWTKQKEQVSPSNTSKRRTRDSSPLSPSNSTTGRQIA